MRGSRHGRTLQVARLGSNEDVNFEDCLDVRATRTSRPDFVYLRAVMARSAPQRPCGRPRWRRWPNGLTGSTSVCLPHHGLRRVGVRPLRTQWSQFELCRVQLRQSFHCVGEAV